MTPVSDGQKGRGVRRTPHARGFFNVGVLTGGSSLVRSSRTEEGVGQVNGLRGERRVEAPPARRDDGGLADEGLDGAGPLAALRVADGQVGDVVGAHRHVIL